MKIVFQRILEKAREELEEALSSGEALEGWDPDAFEEDVRDFTRKLGHELIQVWAEGKAAQAREQAAYVERQELCTTRRPDRQGL